MSSKTDRREGRRREGEGDWRGGRQKEQRVGGRSTPMKCIPLDSSQRVNDLEANLSARGPYLADIVTQKA